MFVGFHEHIVGGGAVELDNVAQFVGGAGEEIFELLCEGGGRGAMTTACVGGEEEYFE